MFAPYTMAVNNPTLKDEMKKIEKRWQWENNGISLWFVNYPVSQVADIMLPRWEIIPVWEDQIPHIELARKLIKKVNNMYNTNYPLPMALISETPRLVWIDWNDKMSKSLWNTISISASYEEIKRQVNKMYTDPNKISISSIWNIENHIVFKYLDIFYEDKIHLSELKERYIKWWDNSVWDWEIKKLLIKVLNEIIAPIREKRKYYEENIYLVIDAIEKWTTRVRKDALVMLEELRQSMWLLDYGKEFIK
jgi:tryptophanyl-tRNA synthetase